MRYEVNIELTSILRGLERRDKAVLNHLIQYVDGINPKCDLGAACSELFRLAVGQYYTDPITQGFCAELA